MRTILAALLCAAAADAAWYVIGEKPENSRYSQADAKCMFDGKKIAFLGDSNMRYHYFAFNNFLEKGMLIQSYNKKGSTSAGTHDSYEIWTRAYGRSPDGTHLQAMSKKFYAETSYWFIQTTWFADDTPKPMDGHKPNMQSLISELKNYDLVVVNSAWWDLKQWKESERGYEYCGDNWNGDCASSYKSDVTAVADQLMGATKSGGVWRSSSCCGDWKNGIKDVSSIENMNKIAEDVCKSKNCAFADVFGLYGVSDLKDNTVDGKHADRYNYHEWTLRVMEAAERQLKTGCIKGGGGGGGGGGGDAEDEEEEEDDELTPEKFCEDNGYKSKDYDKKRIAYDKVKCEEVVEKNEKDYAACCCEDDCGSDGGGGDASDEDEEKCADAGEQCREEGDCCDAPPRGCFLKKGSSKGKCFDECPARPLRPKFQDDKAYECYEEEDKCKGTGKDCGDDDECCSGRSCFAKTDGDGTCEKECPDDDAYECYEAPCKGTGGKCEEDDDCCSGRSCFPIKGKDGTCEKECPDDKDYDCYEEPCADKGDRCGDDDDCCDSTKCFARKDGKGTCESKCPDDKDYECYEEPCKGTGGGCSKDAECCDGRDCFAKKNGDGTCMKLCGIKFWRDVVPVPSARWRRASTPSTRRGPNAGEKTCPDDKDYECYVEPCTDEGDRCSKDGDCCDSTKCFERKDGKATCEKSCPNDKDYKCYEEPCKGTGGGCSKDSECCDGRDCFERKDGGGTCEMLCGNQISSARWRRASTPSTRRGPDAGEKTCPDDEDYECYVEPCVDTGDRCAKSSDCCDGRDCFEMKNGKATCERECPNDSDYKCYVKPTRKPTLEPTKMPQRDPTRKPTQKPQSTKRPTLEPTRRPTAEPSREPTRRPTDKPTARPVPRPTSKPDSPCRNGRKDGDETDVDCGGSDCGPCEEGDRCRRNDDCEEPTDCINDRCRFRPSPRPTKEPTKNPTRKPTAKPVAQPKPTRPPTREPTRDPTRRPTDKPTMRPIPRPTSPPESPCRNGRRDGDETDVDCGGRDCGPCDRGGRCKVSDDCEDPLACVDDRCVFPPTPEPTREPTDRPVAPPPDDDDDDDDAPSDDGPSCANDQRDGAETDIDCGGPTCDPCRLGRDCEIDGDCESGLCDGVCRRVVAPPPPPEERNCPPRMELVSRDECPADPDALPRCTSWAMNEMCLGDGTCGTDENAGNCIKQRRRLQQGEPFAVYRALGNSGKKSKKSNAMPGYGIALLVLFLLSLACLCCCFVAYALRNPSRNRTDIKPRNLEPMKGRRGSKHRRRSHHGHLPRDYVDAPPPYKTEESIHFVEESKIEPQQSYVEAERRGRRAAERNPMVVEARAVADLDEPRYAEPRHVEPRRPEPRYAEPRHAEPRRPEPRYAEPRRPEPRYAEPRRSGVGDANYWRDRARAAGAGAGAAYYGRDDEHRRTASPPQRAVAYRTESPQSAESPLARYTARTGGSSSYWRDRARAAGVAPRGESLPRARSAPYLTEAPAYRAAAPSPPRRDYRAESPPYREAAPIPPYREVTPRRSPTAHLDDLEPVARPPPLGSPERRRPTPIIATRLPASPLLSPLTASPGVLPRTKSPTFLVAIEDFRATRPGQVDLTRGDRVICLDDSDAVWWRGSCRGRVGLFPADAVEPQS